MKRLILSLFALSISQIGAQTVVWEDKSHGQLLFDCNGGDPGGEHFAPNNNLWGQSLLIAGNPCFDSPEIPRALELSNWTSSNFPDSPNVDVALAGSTSVTDLLGDVSVSSLTVAATNELRIGTSGTLSVFGGMIHNNGQITFNEDFTFFATLEINADTSLTGTGTTLFSSNGDNLITSSNAAHTLTIGGDQKLLTSAASTAGRSHISAALINQGRITADVGGLQSDTNPKTNTSTIEAINGGTIVLRDVAVDNTGGVLKAGTASLFGSSANAVVSLEG